MIPKIVHNIWIQSYNSLPKKEKTNLLNLKKLNPKYKFIFWDENKIKHLLEKYPKLLKIYENLEEKKEYTYPWRSDIARFTIMSEYGGIYCDLDFECVSSFDNIFDEKQKTDIYIASSQIDLFKYVYTFNLINNPKYCSCFMAFVKNHPIWPKVFERITNSYFKTQIGEALDIELQESSYKITVLDKKIKGQYQCDNEINNAICFTPTKSSWNPLRPIIKTLNCNKGTFALTTSVVILSSIIFLGSNNSVGFGGK